MLGDMPAKLNDGSPDRLAEVYTGTNLHVVYEPETSITEVSMQVNSVRVRGRSCTLSLRVLLLDAGR
jgi:hypothetical protein